MVLSSLRGKLFPFRFVKGCSRIQLDISKESTSSLKININFQLEFLIRSLLFSAFKANEADFISPSSIRENLRASTELINSTNLITTIPRVMGGGGRKARLKKNLCCRIIGFSLRHRGSVKVCNIYSQSSWATGRASFGVYEPPAHTAKREFS